MVMDMRKQPTLCDYFVVCSAPSLVRVKTIVDVIEETVEDEGFRVLHKEGYKEALWVLMDYGDVVVHVFYEETRRFYDLENLWGDAPKKPYLHP